MSLIDGLSARLRALLHPAASDAGLDDEIAFHLERETEANARRGMSPGEARRAALATFGGVQQTREAHRDVRALPWLGEAWRDAAFSLRSLRRAPLLAATAILTLAVGIGANTAIFSAVSTVILRPLPFTDARRLMMLWESNPEYHWYQDTAAPANVLDWRAQVPAFSDVAWYADFAGTVTLTGLDRPRLLPVSSVSGNFFSVLGVRAERGRVFEDAESWKSARRIAVISHRVWRDVFASDPSIVGRAVTLNGASVEVVGVMPEGFGFPREDVDVWMPSGFDPASRAKTSFRRAHFLRAIARLAPGVSLEDADAQLQTVVRRLQAQYPETNRVMGAGLTPLHDFLVRETRRPLYTLLAAVVLLLLIACANVGNLLLVRAAGREREAALRLTLGAGRGRLVRQAIAESLVLSMLGGIAGVAFGYAGARALAMLQPPGMLPVREVTMDWRVLAYVFVAMLAAGLLFAIAPAVWAGHRSAAELLKEGGRSASAGRRARRWSDLLVIGEVAFALLLTIGAGLLVRTLRALQQVDPGFDGRGVLVVSLDATGPKYRQDDRIVAFYDQLVARARALPGVTAAAAAAEVPLTNWGWTSQLAARGWPAGKYVPEIAHREVTPGYFAAMHVPILRGRDITPEDAHGPPVIVVNQALARAAFPGEDPIGKVVAFDKTPDSTSQWRTIIGVVGNERQSELGTDVKPQAMAPLAQDARTDMQLVVRTSRDPLALAPDVRRIVAELDPDLAILKIRTMDEIRSASLAKQRFLMSMLLLFAGAGVFLALIGVYGVTAQLARSRMREMGIRLALGARAAQLRWLVLRRALVIVGVGTVLGLGAAVMSTRALAAFLFGVQAVDPVTFMIAPAALLVVAVIASAGPARRAAAADPAITLREE